MSKQIPKICSIGHSFRCHPGQMRCECGRELMEKHSDKGLVVLVKRTKGGKKICAAGGVVTRTGKRQRKDSFGECESAIQAL